MKEKFDIGDTISLNNSENKEIFCGFVRRIDERSFDFDYHVVFEENKKIHRTWSQLSGNNILSKKIVLTEKQDFIVHKFYLPEIIDSFGAKTTRSQYWKCKHEK